MNILITINKNYLCHAFVMLNSLRSNNLNENIKVYIISNDVKESDVADFFKWLRMDYSIILFNENLIKDAPTTTRYPSIIYYRLFASILLPQNEKRALYLDPDVIVLKSLKELYNLDFEGNCYIGASNIKKMLTKFNQIKNKAQKGSPYINTGVLLINLELLRTINLEVEIHNYLKKNKKILILPDQDILQGLFGNKVKVVNNLIYNLSERAIRKCKFINGVKINNGWIEENTVLIHYIGKNKPWNDKYRGILKEYYTKYVNFKINKEKDQGV